MREILRDKSRDKLAQDLNSLGIRAELAQRGRAEEKVDKSWFQRSLGIIDVPDGAVRWINILKKDASKNSPPLWWVVLGIPDQRPLAEHRAVDIKTVRKRAFPLFGRVLDVTWRGKDHHTGLVGALSADEAVKALAKRIGNLVIHSHAREFEGWTLTVDKLFRPTSEDWETIQRIASRILTSARLY